MQLPHWSEIAFWKGYIGYTPFHALSLFWLGASKCLTSRLIMDFNIVNEFSEQSLHGLWSLQNQPAFIYVDLIYLNVTTGQTNAYLAKVWT